MKERKTMFNWFARKPAPTPSVAPESLALRNADATVPHKPGDRLQIKQAPVPVGHLPSRKNERLEHRELLYKVVHDAMIRAGVLASSYKFKVLSLDARGLQYMIMMDLANSSAGGTSRLSEIEAMMAQAAKARHDILITAVYWRVNEQVTTGLSPKQTEELPVVKPSETPTRGGKPVPAYEPLQQDEVDAFKRALASAANVTPMSVLGRMVTSGRRNPAPVEEFEDTQIVPSDERASPLSVTQYGDLN
jgi:hypothetical protein